MIQDVDGSLKALIEREALNGSKVEVAFDAPTKEWASRRSAPTLDVYLYDIREDLERREVAYEEVRDEEGRVLERRAPARRFKLSYLVTAWTQRPEDEHRLLSAILGCFLRYEALPREVLSGYLADVPVSTLVTVALPPPKDRNISDVWSALGGELKPSIDLVITAPFDTGKMTAAGPPVLEEPRITVVRPEAEPEVATPRRRSPRSASTGQPPAAGDETEPRGKGSRRGRVTRGRGGPR